MDREKKGPCVKLDSCAYEFWDSSALGRGPHWLVFQQLGPSAVGANTATWYGVDAELRSPNRWPLERRLRHPATDGRRHGHFPVDSDPGWAGPLSLVAERGQAQLWPERGVHCQQCVSSYSCPRFPRSAVNASAPSIATQLGSAKATWPLFRAAIYMSPETIVAGGVLKAQRLPSMGVHGLREGLGVQTAQLDYLGDQVVNLR